jgi:hypothetical protein
LNCNITIAITIVVYDDCIHFDRFFGIVAEAVMDVVVGTSDDEKLLIV